MDENRKENQLESKIDLLVRKMDNIHVAEYMEMISNPRRLIFMNFTLGLARGLGMGIGFTILGGAFIYLMQRWVDLPFIGKLIADLLDIIENYR